MNPTERYIVLSRDGFVQEQTIADRETTIKDIRDGQYEDVIRVIGVDGNKAVWDASCDIACALADQSHVYPFSSGSAAFEFVARELGYPAAPSFLGPIETKG